MAGHVFVIHGDLTALTCDAALLPMGVGGDVVQPWAGLLAASGRPVPALDEREWVSEPIAMAGMWTRFVVSGFHAPTPDEIAARLEAGLAALAGDDFTSERTGRARPLVALPMLGTRAGGLAGRHGEVAWSILSTLHDLAPDLPFDVVLVCWSRSSFAAAQRIRRDLAKSAVASPELQDLVHRIRAGQVTLFVGAGTSAAARLNDWKGLLSSLAAEVASVDPNPTWRDGFDSLALVDQAELLAAAVDRQPGGHNLADLVRKQLSTTTDGRAPLPSLQHWLLAGLGVSEVVTTNFDLLLDRALSHAASPAPVKVLPWDAVGVGERWLLKLHGDVKHGAITLSRDDYLGYDATRRPLASVVQAQLLTRHMLLVGFSLDDDNFVRLARGVRSMLTQLEGVTPEEPLATALMPRHQPARERLWDNAVRFIPATLDQEGSESFRQIEIWLDSLALRSANDHSYLLDPDYRGMLSPADHDLAEALDSLPSNWVDSAGAPQVASLLRSLGGLDGRDHTPGEPRLRCPACGWVTPLPHDARTVLCWGCGASLRRPTPGQGGSSDPPRGSGGGLGPVPPPGGSHPKAHHYPGHVAVAVRIRRRWSDLLSLVVESLAPGSRFVFEQSFAVVQQPGMLVVRSPALKAYGRSPKELSHALQETLQSDLGLNVAVKILTGMQQASPPKSPSDTEVHRHGDPPPDSWPEFVTQAWQCLVSDHPDTASQVRSLRPTAVSRDLLWLEGKPATVEQLEDDPAVRRDLHHAALVSGGARVVLYSDLGEEPPPTLRGWGDA